MTTFILIAWVVLIVVSYRLAVYLLRKLDLM